jgi:outer membrane protein assembly factor BamB
VLRCAGQVASQSEQHSKLEIFTPQIATGLKAWQTGFNKSHMKNGTLLIPLLLASVVSLVPAADWNQWRGPNRDGIAPDCPPLSWPATGPKLLWKSEVIPANLNGGFGSVSIANQRVYVFVSWQRGFKGAEGPQDVIVCLDEASGMTLWMTGFLSVKNDHCSGSTPCVAGDKVFVFGSQRLYCLDAKTGRALWQSGVTGAQISSSPLSADNRYRSTGSRVGDFGAFLGSEAN